MLYLQNMWNFFLSFFFFGRLCYLLDFFTCKRTSATSEPQEKRPSLLETLSVSRLCSVVAFFLAARIWGEGSVIRFLPALFFGGVSI